LIQSAYKPAYAAATDLTMPIVNLTDLLRHAEANRSTVPEIEAGDLVSLLADLATADALATPLIVSAGSQSFSDVGREAAMAAVERAAGRAGIPVALHLDGVSDEPEFAAAIRLGFCAVTLASNLPARDRAELIRIAEDCGITLGDRQSGTEHSDTDRKVASGVRWVTHDATSGDFAGLIHALGTGGRSEEFLRECRVWSPVEHVVEFNPNGLNEEEVAELLELGTHQLGTIPGVREVRTGRAVAEDARYRFCWFIRFANPAVIDSFNRHPTHVAFADRHFRPIAKDRLTTNYVLRVPGPANRH